MRRAFLRDSHREPAKDVFERGDPAGFAQEHAAEDEGRVWALSKGNAL